MAVGQFPVFNTGGFSTGACLLRAFGKVSALPHLHKHATPPMTCNEHRAPHGAALAGCVDIKQGLKLAFIMSIIGHTALVQARVPWTLPGHGEARTPSTGQY